MKKVICLTTLLGSSTLLAVENLNQALSQADVVAQVRLGAVQSENDAGKKASTLALGGALGVYTKPISGISAGVTFYTTNALLGKNDEVMFLSSEGKSYAIVGEAFLQASLGKSLVRAGRQIVDTPFADSDDIGMISNTFEGYTVVNQDITDTTVVLAKLDRWSGVDSKQSERFTKLESKGDGVLLAGAVFEGIEKTTLQAWHYRLDEVNFNYAEAGYKTERFTVATQYTDQDNDNRAFGLMGCVSMGDWVVSSAYNRVEGMVSNGFGGGPFFTSSEDHTVAEVVDQEALMVGAEYAIGDMTLSCTHVDFDKGANETDYLASYAVGEALSVDLIYADMYDDGKLTRFFVNYNF
ncbi:MAG: outer membrane porin, OprD family [Campylobacterales bacterium]|nr:outer membrane porin, OprD family [Campylobacterales bacterium]